MNMQEIIRYREKEAAKEAAKEKQAGILKIEYLPFFCHFISKRKHIE